MAHLSRRAGTQRAWQITLHFYGGDDQLKESCRDSRGTRWVHDLGQDLRFAVRLLRKAAEQPWLIIIGVSRTVRQNYGQDLDPVVYVPYRRDPTRTPVVFVRATAEPETAVPALRDGLRELDPELVLFNIMSLDQLLNGTGFANRVF